jgi:WD40 repeat protein
MGLKVAALDRYLTPADSIQVWDSGTGLRLRLMEGHSQAEIRRGQDRGVIALDAVAIPEGPPRLLSTGGDGTLRLYCGDTLEALHILLTGVVGVSLTVHPGRHPLVLAADSPAVAIHVSSQSTGSRAALAQAAPSARLTFVLSPSQVWAAETGELVRTLPPARDRPSAFATFSPVEGQEWPVVVVGTLGGRLATYDLAQQQWLWNERAHQQQSRVTGIICLPAADPAEGGPWRVISTCLGLVVSVRNGVSGEALWSFRPGGGGGSLIMDWYRCQEGDRLVTVPTVAPTSGSLCRVWDLSAPAEAPLKELRVGSSALAICQAEGDGGGVRVLVNGASKQGQTHVKVSASKPETSPRGLVRLVS